ncbi:hypothetical protein HMPREF0454_01775 [Hafnia alvei ATCC 51873]|uniref:Uncharacterized protein n=1 Tax=Hafnia alvei ATCC 51873 TaxID=1002364 RepID=G9Y5D3_HAFAL|nr:hypothetical protein HMPREF0454_01775 [Hafnia alvei ATCC 51873]
MSTMITLLFINVRFGCLFIRALNVCWLQHPQNNYCQNHSGIATLCWQL